VIDRIGESTLTLKIDGSRQFIALLGRGQARRLRDCLRDVKAKLQISDEDLVDLIISTVEHEVSTLTQEGNEAQEN